jgi:processive 1,2-diacylglycerol beta-glucosyltransferase
MKRTLILSANTGEGHNSCARALKECFEAHGVPCDITDSLSFISKKASKFICNWHVRIYRHLPRLFKSGYDEVEKHASPFQKDTLIYEYLTSGSERLYKYIRKGGYDCVICTHIFAALALTAMMEKHHLPIKTAFVATDYTCSPGAADSALQYYFIPAEALREEFEYCGVPAGKIIASGLPARAQFYTEGDRDAAKRMLGIPHEHSHLLMMCGSMGCGPMAELTEKLSALLPVDAELTVICGSNEKLHEQLDDEFYMNPHVHIEAKVSNMPLYMRSADVYITKPGGLSTTEAAAMGLPMVLVDAVAGCESHNLEYFTGCGGAVTADTPDGLAAAAIELINDAQRRSEMSAALRGTGTETPAECIYRVMDNHEQDRSA